MKKLIFMGILLVSGLFSLQYTLMGNSGWLPTGSTISAVQPSASCTHFQVIYVYPQDTLSIQMQKIVL